MKKYQRERKARKKRQNKKGINRDLDQNYLDMRKRRLVSGNWPISKWIVFSEYMLNQGYSVVLYEAVTTVSKYITVTKGQLSYKVRFSNHKANKHREFSDDSDFYVGVGNRGVTTTEEAIQATMHYLNGTSTQSITDTARNIINSDI